VAFPSTLIKETCKISSCVLPDLHLASCGIKMNLKRLLGYKKKKITFYIQILSKHLTDFVNVSH
jgi:hypothetical protein